MSPNWAIPSHKSIRFSPLAAACPLTIPSWPEAQCQWLHACLLDDHERQCLLSPCPDPDNLIPARVLNQV